MIVPMARIYRCFDADDQLLYIGMTGQTIEDRLKSHRYHSSWFKDLARVTVSDEMERREALIVERDAIEAEWPLHNARPRPRPALPPIELAGAVS